MKEKIHKEKIEIGPSSFFDDQPSGPLLVTVASGCYAEQLPIAGKTVAEIRSEFSVMFDIAPQSTAVIGGKDSAEDVVLKAGETLMFMNRAGEKGFNDYVAIIKWQDVCRLASELKLKLSTFGGCFHIEGLKGSFTAHNLDSLEGFLCGLREAKMKAKKK